MMQLSGEQVDVLRRHWKLEPWIRFHRKVANRVYFATLMGRPVVLRLTERSHRRREEIVSELDWIRCLCHGGLRIACPVLSDSGSAIVELPGESGFYAVVFEWAPGVALGKQRELDADGVREWGRYLGQMHRLTKVYRPLSGIEPRQQWMSDGSLAIARRSLEASDQLPYRRLNELLEWMGDLSQNEDSYGLVHTDLHHGNFTFDNGQITAFDFDDSCYHWFSYDFVAPLNAIRHLLSDHSRGVERAAEVFFESYALENQLAPIWRERVAVFKKYRAALMYHWAKTGLREKLFDENGLAWARETMPKLIEELREPLKLI